MELQRLGNIDTVLAFAIEKEREAQATYLAYAKATERTGFRKLLLSMVGQEREHEKRLLALQSGGDLDVEFPGGKSLDIRISDYTVDVEFSPEMSYQDFLILVMKREQKAAELYEWLTSQGQNQEVRSIFERLTEEERKHKAWAQDRYDLEILSEN